MILSRKRVTKEPLSLRMLITTMTQKATSTWSYQVIFDPISPNPIFVEGLNGSWFFIQSSVDSRSDIGFKLVKLNFANPQRFKNDQPTDFNQQQALFIHLWHPAGSGKLNNDLELFFRQPSSKKFMSNKAIVKKSLQSP